MTCGGATTTNAAATSVTSSSCRLMETAWLDELEANAKPAREADRSRVATARDGGAVRERRRSTPTITWSSSRGRPLSRTTTS